MSSSSTYSSSYRTAAVRRVELKVGKFEPEYAGQLGFYVELVEKQLRRRQHAATIESHRVV